MSVLSTLLSRGSRRFRPSRKHSVAQRPGRHRRRRFTDFGIENLIELTKIYKEPKSPDKYRRVGCPRPCGLRGMLATRAHICSLFKFSTMDASSG